MRISDWSSDVCSSDLALLDYGIRCVISTSFADIFFNNSFKNGILPIRVSKDELEALMADASDRENPELTIDLEKQEIRRRSEEHTSELQSLMRISYAVFCLKKKKQTYDTTNETQQAKHKNHS